MNAHDVFHKVYAKLTGIGVYVQKSAYTNYKRVNEGLNEVTERALVLTVRIHEDETEAEDITFVFDDAENLLEIK